MEILEDSKTYEEKKIDLISVDGRIDALTVGTFEEKTLALVDNENYGSYILDFEKLVYISSAGLRAVLKLAKKCKEVSKKLVVCNLSENVLEVFKISGFDLIITVCDNLENAVAKGA